MPVCLSYTAGVLPIRRPCLFDWYVPHRVLLSFTTRRSSDLNDRPTFTTFIHRQLADTVQGRLNLISIVTPRRLQCDHSLKNRQRFCTTFVPCMTIIRYSIFL